MGGNVRVDSRLLLYAGIKTAISVGAVILALSGRKLLMGFGPVLIIGLCLCASGDFFLALSGETQNEMKQPWFQAGVFCFGLAHLALCAFLFSITGFRVSPALLASPATMLLFAFLQRRKVLIVHKCSKATMAYSLMLGLFLGVGLDAWLFSGVWTAGLAAILFWSSDFCICLNCFWPNSRRWIYDLILPTYYAALYLLAVTLAFVI